MRLKTSLLALLFSIIPLRSQAVTIVVDPSIATASAISPSSIIDSDLKTHVWSIHPTAGLFSGSSNTDGNGGTTSSNGYGGTLEAQYSYNDHIGINYSALAYKGSGNYSPGIGELEGSSGTTTLNGWLAGASLVLDPFSGDGFRMPFFFGLNYEHIASSTPTSGLITGMTLSTFGTTLGFSPRFNLGFLRFEPFIIMVTPLSEGNVTCASNVIPEVCGAQHVQLLPVFGVNIVFRPWNLAFYFNLSSTLLGTGVSYYSLGPQITLGI